MNGNGNGSAGPPRPAMISWDQWLRQIGRTHTTGWRWRKAGWINTINIAGRVYVSQASIDEFIARAERGEFSKEHVVPTRPRLQEEAA